MPIARPGGLLLVLCLSGCLGAPVEPGQCRNALDCEVAEACLRPNGTCDGLGSCSARPELCTRDYRPVCGCDGIEYPNLCVAHAAGVSVAREGGC